MVEVMELDGAAERRYLAVLGIIKGRSRLFP
jgi:hypothetical protein